MWKSLGGWGWLDETLSRVCGGEAPEDDGAVVHEAGWTGAEGRKMVGSH